MGDTCAVELKVRLPAVLAAEVEEVQRRDPDVLRKILVYGLVRRSMFEYLASRGEGVTEKDRLTAEPVGA